MKISINLVEDLNTSEQYIVNPPVSNLIITEGQQDSTLKTTGQQYS